MTQEKKYPLIPLRQGIVMPYSQSVISISRANAMHSLEKLEDGQTILIVAQKDSQVISPQLEDLYSVGTLCTIINIFKLQNKNYSITVKGVKRFQLKKLVTKNDVLMGSGQEMETEICANETEVEAARRLMIENLQQYQRTLDSRAEAFSEIMNLKETQEMADLLAARLNMKVEAKQKILESPKVEERLNLISTHLQAEMNIIAKEQDIRKTIQAKVSEHQEEYMRRLKAEVLSEVEGASEITEWEKKIRKSKMPENIQEKAFHELHRLRHTPSNSGDYNIIQNYLGWLTSLPWPNENEVADWVDPEEASRILKERHYGLDQVSKKVQDLLAVYNRTKKPQGKILLFVGPAGVGKTSMGKAIADAMGRKFARFSLGGVKDEAEIRGHRRTYVGSMPGRLVTILKQVGVMNPVILLDEVDKIVQDPRGSGGDTTGALLEVLDPEQNHAFHDLYLDLPVSLDRVIFICTANSTQNIPLPLLDRMVIVEFSSYTYAEKMQIAKQYILPKHKARAMITDEEFEITDDALQSLISCWAKEPGVRALESCISSLLDHVVFLKDVQKKSGKIKVTPRLLKPYLGRAPLYAEAQWAPIAREGVVRGLAYTEAGGKTLSIEASILPLKGGLLPPTGNLGQVMEQSVKVAYCCASAVSEKLNINFGKIMEEKSIQVHVPSGAIPKDGPSAGAAIFMALISALLGKKVSPYVAITGEISLTGAALPVGGIREKVLAAQREGIKKVLLPRQNESCLEDIEKSTLNKLEVVFYDHILDILPHFFEEEVASVG